MLKIDISFTVTDGHKTIVEEISSRCDLSRSKIKNAMTKGAVWTTKRGKNRRARRATMLAEQGEDVAIYYDEKILGSAPPEPVLIEDKRKYSIWYKPAGLLSSGSRYGDHHAINRWIENFWGRPVFLVHRLDQFASGLMAVAHGKQTAVDLSLQFKERQTTKIYKVIVTGIPVSDFSIRDELDSKEAVSHICVLESSESRSLLSVRIETGRKHQIRRHLAAAGFPVLGDRLHGKDGYPSLQLTSIELGFCCPVSKDAISWVLPAELHPNLADLND
jgi:tRNA pseudouridine32 synthase/23S rRNA pseudouridine746 synthase